MPKTTVRIDDAYYEVDDAVRNRMEENYRDMQAAVRALETLIGKVRHLRHLQRRYFTEKAPDLLRTCKAVEQEIDRLLEGNTPTPRQQQIQTELFR